MIDFIDVEKTYKSGVEALKGVSFTIEDGEFVFIIGKSGSGKSTLLKCITCEETPTSGKVTIGNNVSFGQNVMVLKGVSIGDNCFIGAGSIVTKDIPEGSIAVGAPCRVIMTLDEYYEKRLAQAENEAFEYVRSIYARFGRAPRLEEMTEEFIWFVDGKDIDNRP